MANPVSL